MLVPWERCGYISKLKENGNGCKKKIEIFVHGSHRSGCSHEFQQVAGRWLVQAGSTDDVRSAVVRRPALDGKNREPGNGKHYRLGIRS